MTRSSFVRRLFGAAALILGVGLSSAAAPPVAAEGLGEALAHLVKTHVRVKAAEARLAGAQENIGVVQGDWYPDLTVSGHYGYEDQVKGNNTADTSMPTREGKLSLRQQIWDFGATNSATHGARLFLEQSKTSLEATKKALILEGITAHLDLAKAAKILAFALGAVSNVQRQTELQDSMVRRGSGLSTDALQAKTQLARAHSRRERAAGALIVARNRYRTVFGFEAKNPEKMTIPKAPVEALPKSVENAVTMAMARNPKLRSARLGVDIAGEEINKKRSEEFFPTLNATAESTYKKGEGGTIGQKLEQVIKLEFTHTFNLGGTSFNKLRSARTNHLAATAELTDARNLINEQVHNAWQDLITKRSTATFLRNEAVVAGEFLELARKESQVKQRSLIDVLAGETAVIDANSDATSADLDVVISMFALLGAVGNLEPGMVR
jgi:TolC family type I secretion outer membrane protein